MVAQMQTTVLHKEIGVHLSAKEIPNRTYTGMAKHYGLPIKFGARQYTNRTGSMKPSPIGLSSTSDASDKLLHKRKRYEKLKNRGLPIRRKSGSKRRKKSSKKKITKNTPKATAGKTTKQTTAKRNMTAKGRKHVKWDPICFDNADRDDDDDGDVDENGM